MHFSTLLLAHLNKQKLLPVKNIVCKVHSESDGISKTKNIPMTTSARNKRRLFAN